MISTTLEMGQGLHATLVGIGLPLDLKDFAFANVNLDLRKSERDIAAEQTDTGMQVTLTWKRPFSIGSTKMSFEGFYDYAFGEGGSSAPKEDNIITAPRLLVNLSTVDVGIDGVDEDVAQAMVKWKFLVFDLSFDSLESAQFSTHLKNNKTPLHRRGVL